MRRAHLGLWTFALISAARGDGIPKPSFFDEVFGEGCVTATSRSPGCELDSTGSLIDESHAPACEQLCVQCCAQEPMPLSVPQLQAACAFLGGATAGTSGGEGFLAETYDAVVDQMTDFVGQLSAAQVGGAQIEFHAFRLDYQQAGYTVGTLWMDIQALHRETDRVRSLHVDYTHLFGAARAQLWIDFEARLGNIRQSETLKLLGTFTGILNRVLELCDRIPQLQAEPSCQQQCLATFVKPFLTTPNGGQHHPDDPNGHDNPWSGIPVGCPGTGDPPNNGCGDGHNSNCDWPSTDPQPDPRGGCLPGNPRGVGGEKPQYGDKPNDPQDGPGSGCHGVGSLGSLGGGGCPPPDYDGGAGGKGGGAGGGGGGQTASQCLANGGGPECYLLPFN